MEDFIKNQQKQIYLQLLTKLFTLKLYDDLAILQILYSLQPTSKYRHYIYHKKIL